MYYFVLFKKRHQTRRNILSGWVIVAELKEEDECRSIEVVVNKEKKALQH